MINARNIGQLGSNTHNTDFYMSVIRNTHAVARADNPNADEANEEYQRARSAFITDLTSGFEGEQIVRCAKCTTPMPQGFHVHHLDGDHTNNDMANFEINCPFCHLCEHLGYVGVNNLATIVYAPQLPQATLNQLQIICYAHRKILSQLTQTSQKFQILNKQAHGINLLLQSLASSKITVQRNFQTHDPLHFANVFMEMSEDEYASRATGTFAGLRVLFDASQFSKEIDLFATHILASEVPSNQAYPSQWPDNAKQLM